MTRRAKKKGQMPRSLILKTRFTFYKSQKLLESVPSKLFDKKCVNSKIKLDHVISRFFMIEGLVRVNLNPEAVESEVVELLLVALDSEFVVPYKFGLHAIHDLLLGPYGAENIFIPSSSGKIQVRVALEVVRISFVNYLIAMIVAMLQLSC